MFGEALQQAIQLKQSMLCVGLDIRLTDVPDPYTKDVCGLMEWIPRSIERIAPSCVALKPNFGFYLKHGTLATRILELIANEAHNHGLLCVLDLKCGDGATSAFEYANATIGQEQFAQFDAVTVETSIADPGFNEYVKVSRQTGRGVFLVVRTSFTRPPSRIENIVDKNGMPVWHQYAHMVHGAMSEPVHGIPNIGGVVGATRAVDAKKARHLMPLSPFLVPGFGSQGGTPIEAVAGSYSAIDPRIIVNSSSGIMNSWKKRTGESPLDCVDESAKDARDALNGALAKYWA